jgi:hypothetical protein
MREQVHVVCEELHDLGDMEVPFDKKEPFFGILVKRSSIIFTVRSLSGQLKCLLREAFELQPQ